MQEKPDLRIAVLVGVTLAFLIAIGNLYWQLEHTRAEMTTLRQSILSDVSKVAAAASHPVSDSRRPPAQAEPSRKVLDSIKQELVDELTSTRRQPPPPALPPKAEAVSHPANL